MKTAPPVSRWYLSSVDAVDDFVDVERLLEIDLDARAVFEHAEADGVFAA